MTPICLNGLLEGAFYQAEAWQATVAIDRARARWAAMTHGGAKSYELVVPALPDDDWLRTRMLGPLVCHCESIGATLPCCGGVFLSLFVGDRLYCVGAGSAVAWAREQLGLSIEDLRLQYGMHEQPAAPV
jgi:hypothetical protein